MDTVWKQPVEFRYDDGAGLGCALSIRTRVADIEPLPRGGKGLIGEQSLLHGLQVVRIRHLKAQLNEPAALRI